MKEQECPCDKEHMFSCPADDKISPKSVPSLDSVIAQLGNMVRASRTPSIDEPVACVVASLSYKHILKFELFTQ